MLKMWQWSNWNYGPSYDERLIPARGTRLPSFPSPYASMFNAMGDSRAVGDCGVAQSLGCGPDGPCSECMIKSGAFGDWDSEIVAGVTVRQAATIASVGALGLLALTALTGRRRGRKGR